MYDPASALILGFAYLAVKHALGDFFLQTPYQYLHKGNYGHPGGLLHAGIHATLTAPVFWVIVPASLAIALAILIGEFIVHYHLDWLKERIVDRRGLTSDHGWYWRLLGLDQLLHGLTYVVIMAVLAGVWP